MSDKDYEVFTEKLKSARASLGARDQLVEKAIESIEAGMEFLAVTGVEDKL